MLSDSDLLLVDDNCHNPYFNRWFSAIVIKMTKYLVEEMSQSLF